MAPAVTEKISVAEEVNGKWILQENQKNLQSIALQSWASHPQHLAITVQSKTALIPIAVATVHNGYGKHDRSDMLNGVIHIWSQASCIIMSRRRSTMHSPSATGQEEHDSQTLSTGVHLSCLSVSADNPFPGHRIREVEDYTAEFNQYGR
jgi:hypothetical protein